MCEEGHPLGSKKVGKVAIFEVFGIKCRVEFDICVKGATLSVPRRWATWPFLKFLKSSVESVFKFIRV
jgi:hypothetical protein